MQKKWPSSLRRFNHIWLQTRTNAIECQGVDFVVFNKVHQPKQQLHGIWKFSFLGCTLNVIILLMTQVTIFIVKYGYANFTINNVLQNILVIIVVYLVLNPQFCKLVNTSIYISTQIDIYTLNINKNGENIPIIIVCNLTIYNI